MNRKPTSSIDNLLPIPKEGEMILDDEATAAVVIKLRDEWNISQKQLAGGMGISQAYLSDLEAGNRRWSLELFNKMKSAMRDLA